MSPELRSVRTRQFIAALERDGFRKTHQTGSHATYRKDGRRVMVAIHVLGETIPVGLLAKMIADAGWDEDDLKRLRLAR